MRKTDLKSHHQSGRTMHLLAATHELHENLDASVKAANPFSNPELYGRFLQVLHQFQWQIDPLYFDSRVEDLLPGLADRGRLHLIEQDLVDLGIGAADMGHKPQFDANAAYDLPTALGWLFVAEGAKLGAAALLGRANVLGFSESFGARHMAAAPEGRAAHWKAFAAAFDALELTAAEEARALAGGCAAFTYVHDLVNLLLTPSKSQEKTRE